MVDAFPAESFTVAAGAAESERGACPLLWPVSDDLEVSDLALAATAGFSAIGGGVMSTETAVSGKSTIFRSIRSPTNRDPSTRK